MLALVGAAGAGGVGSAPQDGQQKRSLLDMDDLSAATWLAELAATGGARLRKTESQHARAANHGQEQTQHSNKCANVGKANIDLVRQIQRKARRKNQGDLVRQLDAVLPQEFRRGVSFNGAGSRALGITGRSLHDVLEDSVMTVAWLRAAKRQKVDATACDTTSTVGVNALQTLPSPPTSGDSCGQHMRAFLDSNGGLDDMLTDVFPFVSLTARLDTSGRRKYGKGAKQTRESSLAVNTCSRASSTGMPRSASAVTHPSPYSLCSSPTTVSRTSSISPAPAPILSSLAPLLIDNGAAALGDLFDCPRLPPISVLSSPRVSQLSLDTHMLQHGVITAPIAPCTQTFGVQHPFVLQQPFVMHQPLLSMLQTAAHGAVAPGQQVAYCGGGDTSNLLQQLLIHKMLLQQRYMQLGSANVALMQDMENRDSAVIG